MPTTLKPNTTQTQEVQSEILQEIDSLKGKIDDAVLSRIQAQSKFEALFVKDAFDYFTYDFKAEDLPLLDYMRSSDVNNPEKNRAKNDDNVKRLYRCLKAGEWYFESIDILINKNGELLNGQHTLEAINQFLLDASTPRKTSVKVGFKVAVNSKAMPYLDTQRKRTPEQNLRIKQGGVNYQLNKAQHEIVIREGKRLVHGSAFGSMGVVNFFEYDSVIKKHSKMLNNVFGNRSFCQDFPHVAISFPLFTLAKEDEELANTILDEICNFRNQGDSERSDYKDAPKEHEVIEEFRRLKFIKMNNMTSKTSRDCYRSEEFYPVFVDWLVENYDVNPSIFTK